MSPVFRLLLKNTSPARIAGFIASNFTGLLIIIGAIIFYQDAKTLWDSDDSFIRSDMLVINKKVTSASLWGEGDTSFGDEEIEDIRKQPWVREVGKFLSNNYKVMASVGGTGRGMSTMLFFESVPDKFVDGVDPYDWDYNPESPVVPVIISKDYLALYNFGFAGSQGLPRLSESLMSSIPLELTLTSEDGMRMRRLNAKIVGFSSRLNTILVPEKFLETSNAELGNGNVEKPSRLIIDVSSPGDVAINQYLADHDLEVAGDKNSSSASYLLKVITGVVITVGALITLLSFFILLLSVSLLMEKNRGKLHSLLMLGYKVKDVAAPYYIIVAVSSALAYGGAVLCALLLRDGYQKPLEGLGAGNGSAWVGLMTGGILTFFIIVVNLIAVRRRVVKSWR